MLSAPRSANEVTPEHTSAVGVIAPARFKSRKLSSGKRLHYSATTVLPLSPRSYCPFCYHGTFLSSS